MEVQLKKIKMVISGKDLLQNSANKLNRSMDEVKAGAGAHKSLKDYKRKPKHFKGWD